jgi:hypothetical protein
MQSPLDAPVAQSPQCCGEAGQEPLPSTSSAGSRKRHSSQNLRRATKDSRTAVDATQYKYELLNNAGSYPDRSMKPASVFSKLGVPRLMPG